METSNIFERNFSELKSLVGAGDEQKGGVLLDFLSVTLKTLVASGEDEQYLLDDFAGCLRHSDIKYFTIKAMLAIVKERRPEAKNAADRFTDNAAKLLVAVKLPNGNSAKGQKELAALKPLVLDSGFRLNYESASKLYSDTWLLLLSFKLSFESYKKILAAMDSRILPHFESPLSLADFLIHSYRIGGSVSLLSLSSLFLLITKYNLDYPDFFTNFYALCTPEILHVKYRARFLYWADVFLSSTNLPAYVVASFVKRFSRLALLASVETLYSLIPLIVNCLIRHSNLIDLFNRPTGSQYGKDPFDFEQTDLQKTRALESSLWELIALQTHWDSKVREAARLINRPLPKDELDLSDLLEIDFPGLAEQAFSADNDA